MACERAASAHIHCISDGKHVSCCDTAFPKHSAYRVSELAIATAMLVNAIVESSALLEDKLVEAIERVHERIQSSLIGYTYSACR